MHPTSKVEEDLMSKDDVALQALFNYLREDMEACNREIVARMQSPVPLIPQLGAHLVAAGGKRLRPLLTLASAYLCGYHPSPQRRRHVGLAACVEFIHTATLLHDDVVDESVLRRGAASANAVFGNKASVLVGDFLFARSFQLMTEDGSLPVMAVLSQAAATIAEGEVLQMSMQNDLATSEDTYLKVIHGKTAALFAAACRVGAIIADSPPRDEKAVEDFGTHLGIAFQLVDDALDYVADEKVLGKTVGDDLREGKITLPLLVAYRQAEGKDRQFWERVVNEGKWQEKDLAEALRLIQKTHAVEETMRRAQFFAEKAVAALDVFPESDIKSLLSDTALYAARRAH